MKLHNCILFVLLINYVVWGQNKAIDSLPSHQDFLKVLDNSDQKVYDDILQQYATHLAKHPDDLHTRIERCKFVQYAQYDDYEDYNPNQAYFDSLTNKLLHDYPTHPEVLVYHTSFSWGTQLDSLLANASDAIKAAPTAWSATQQGVIYYEMASNYYNDEKYRLAWQFIEKAIQYDPSYKTSLLYAKVLIHFKQHQKAIQCLAQKDICSSDIWELSQKARLLLDINAYSDALDTYQTITTIDPTYVNTAELAKTLEGVGEYASARTYFVKDTVRTWNKEQATLSLFLHDLAHQNQQYCVESYTAYRDHGYHTDPLAIYRLQLLFKHPLLEWKIRDVLGICTLLLIIGLLICIPSIWVLPIYFIGHKWNIIQKTTAKKWTWGLKSFWWISSGYLIASFAALLVAPLVLNSWITWTATNVEEITGSKLGQSTLLFIIVFAVWSFAVLSKKTIAVFFPKDWSLSKNILVAIKYFIVFKIISFLYIRIGGYYFGIEHKAITNCFTTLAASREDIIALVDTYGILSAYLLVGILVPIYEELIFRGVIFDATKRYIYARWAMVLQSFLFAIIHGDLFLCPVFFLFGILSGQLRKNSDSLLPGIIFHTVNNLLALLVIDMQQHL